MRKNLIVGGLVERHRLELVVRTVAVLGIARVGSAATYEAVRLTTANEKVATVGTCRSESFLWPFHPVGRLAGQTRPAAYQHEGEGGC